MDMGQFKRFVFKWYCKRNSNKISVELSCKTLMFLNKIN